MKRLTIFTPTYNRAYILPKLYESLCQQTCQDFEWLVVDDGSADNTKELVEGWMREGKVAIRLFCQENGGKMRAYNHAVSMSASELFVCIDSDDQLSNKHVVKHSLDYWDLHRADYQELPVAGMVSVRKSLHGRHDLTAAPTHGKLFELCGYYGGETTIFLLTDILRNYPYPNFEGEKFVTDAYIYDRIDEDYQFIFHPYISQNCEYHQDGYTMSYRKLLFYNPRGHREYHAQRIRLRKPGWVNSVICYISLSLFVRDHTMFSASPHRLLTCLLYPAGCLKYALDRYLLSKEK
jgi:glycosyltransferase involved in cell wall biosynthesis